MSFEPGSQIVLRETWKGRVWEARAAIVVEDAPERTLLYVSPRSPKKRASWSNGQTMRFPVRDWILASARSSNRHVLSFAWPDRSHGVLLSWDGDSGEFNQWYVNLQTPLQRTSLGFDATDHILDVVVEPDRSYRFKDDDELEEAVTAGLFTADDVDAFHAERERIVAAISARTEPFDDSYLAWKPDAAWGVPALLDGWDTEPVEPVAG